LSQTSLQSAARDTCEPTLSLDRNQFQSVLPRATARINLPTNGNQIRIFRCLNS
jgi:hypothetical protein